MAIKVRPFAETIEGTRVGTTLELRGSIRDGLFVLALFGREFEVPARAVGADKRGPFALLDESEQRLDFGAYLRIRPEYEPEMPPGGEIEIVSEQFSRERWAKAARAQGIDPTRVNLIVPPQRSVSLHFDDDGNVDGRGTLG